MRDQREVAQQCSEKLLQHDHAANNLGIKIVDVSPGHATAKMTVTEAMLNGVSFCHGGVLFTLADTAFQHACNTHNNVTVAASGEIDFLRPAVLGDVITAVCQELKRGRKNGIYDITICNQKNQMIAVFRGRSFATDKPLLD
ncbi:MAG: hydroxyphenylacetyl-CoA thioesterase PaaI [Pseudomonadota bacterium]